MIAKLFARILEQRTATRVEEQAVKANGQARFGKDFCISDQVFVLRSLIDKQR